jgi:di/tricarboxylate transporter
MTQDQIILFTLFTAVFGMLLWGRFRYDLVAFSALMIAVVLGVVDSKDAFDGFGHRLSWSFLLGWFVRGRCC